MFGDADLLTEIQQDDREAAARILETQRAAAAGHPLAWRAVHFSIDEFAHSDTHPTLVQPVPNEYRPAVAALALELDVIRDVADRPLKVLSGYRSPALNAAAGGSPTSQHLHAQAADLTPAHLAAGETADRVMRGLFRTLMRQQGLAGKGGVVPGYHLGQIILYPGRGFMHVALPSPRFGTPTFCVHAPAYGYTYQVVPSLTALATILQHIDSGR